VVIKDVEMYDGEKGKQSVPQIRKTRPDKLNSVLQVRIHGADRIQVRRRFDSKDCSQLLALSSNSVLVFSVTVPILKLSRSSGTSKLICIQNTQHCRNPNDFRSSISENYMNMYILLYVLIQPSIYFTILRACYNSLITCDF
jgi:hypothetical protein